MGLVRHSRILAGLSCTLSLLAGTAIAADTSGGFTVGSTNVAVADPSVPRPPGKPCVVELFNDVTFTDFNSRPYAYAPPDGCQGHWAKVVLEADFSVTAGRQFDRTATLWLGGVNLYFGTTQEPSSKVAPSWHVERDLSDYGSLLRSAQQGQAIIGNIVNGTYTGVIHGSARLLFYPGRSPVRAPDGVYPLGADPIGNTTALNGPADKLAKTLSLPRNIERAYLDVFAQSQGGDEFWYTCVPDAYAQATQECGGGNFRETEVSIDGQPAGVAPVYPWIYTGGMDPYLWRPTPGVQTLNFTPYRVDLTPFAGQLSDGAPHEVAVSVAGAHGYFSATATLLVYRDAWAQQVSGQVTSNTLVGQQPEPTIGSTLVTGSNDAVSGDITTGLKRQFVIEGYADTSHGRVRSKVAQTVGFADTQTFTINSAGYRQISDQVTSVDSVSQSRIGPFVTTEYREKFSYPLHVDFNQVIATDGSNSSTTTVHQGYEKHDTHRLFGIDLYSAKVSNSVDSADTLNFNASGALTSHNGQHSTQAFAFRDSLGSCYRTDLSTLSGALATYSEGQGCPGQSNRVFWFSRPDGSPASGNPWSTW
ncbi:peptide-N(4)-(N-acetyl-beta-glucosaminyl)asparagine amidase [Dyella tabacisoli]|uniref:Peptide-N(4)-(N-acetyl-beta-glucosaminyl)asparagine amidase n=2 Tax=Dyella tabacisoli TaxID=2282381 RepID=A0A369UKF4_9GAMM|nr:peptide-N(4)-(N-acetyl-beta-glucosaminyl)asparagine amidase [Dyella tabacisoli]